ncbi:hypothetical protein BJF92_15265 [Rhizobium rhizosphaerae]|uniref:Uncharacterized protein n=1 Tax=Xaviernesmea rhizosphaerae TaxID=1672749 RepID=A0A1Q9ALN9_9HYPH|nr:hypothetical protein BJF92_15265 [Xaviernesmea rhizosphaerae]
MKAALMNASETARSAVLNEGLWILRGAIIRKYLDRTRFPAEAQVRHPISEQGEASCIERRNSGPAFHIHVCSFSGRASCHHVRSTDEPKLLSHQLISAGDNRLVGAQRQPKMPGYLGGRFTTGRSDDLGALSTLSASISNLYEILNPRACNRIQPVKDWDQFHEAA